MEEATKDDSLQSVGVTGLDFTPVISILEFLPPEFWEDFKKAIFFECGINHTAGKKQNSAQRKFSPPISRVGNQRPLRLGRRIWRASYNRIDAGCRHYSGFLGITVPFPGPSPWWKDVGQYKLQTVAVGIWNPRNLCSSSCLETWALAEASWVGAWSSR